MWQHRSPVRRLCSLLSLTLALAGSGGCRDGRDRGELRIDAPWDRWTREGFVLLVPSAHAPSSSAAIDQVTIWARMSDDAQISTVEGARGPALRFPAGTELDRVEYAGEGAQRQVIDVRGTRIDEHGVEHFHVYRKLRPGRDAPMFGFEWRADDPDAHATATEALLAKLTEVPPGLGMDEEKRRRYLDDLRAKNQCAPCHEKDRAPNSKQGEHGLVNRGTDASGFFTPLAVLSASVPVERYGAHDPNLTDPHVTITCDDAEPIMGEDGRPRCVDQRVPLATTDLSAGGARAEQVCRSRRYLFDRLDQRGRELFAASLSDCEDIGTGG